MSVLTAAPAGAWQAVQAYRDAGALDGGASAAGTSGAAAQDGFGAMLSRAVQGAVALGHDADSKSIAAINGHGSITDVVTAVSKAELALQTTASIRDRMVQAYQDVMRMPM